MKLADLARKTKRVTLAFEDETVHLEVRYQLITQKLIADIAALNSLAIDLSEQTAEKLHTLGEQVARLVASWDVLDDDGQMFPLDPERLAAEIPMMFLAQVLGAAAGAIYQGEAPAPQAE
jgi:hypothetical protein